MYAADERLQLRSALLGLEQSHLSEQSYQAGRHLILHATQPVNALVFLRDILSRLGECNRTARKFRYRLATLVVQTAGFHAQSLPLLQLASKLAIACISLEIQAADVEELGALMSALTLAVVKLPQHEAGQSCTLHAVINVVLEPLSAAVARAPSQETAASGHVLLGSALQVLAEEPSTATINSQALLSILQQQLHSIKSGSPRMQVAQAFTPVRECLRGLRANTPAAAVKACLKACLHGIRHKEQWAMRREACDTLATLAESLQVRENGASTTTGELPPGTAALLYSLPKLLGELEGIRYDKILHVRTSCSRVLKQLQLLAACCHRSDIAPMPMPERPTTSAPQRPITASGKSTGMPHAADKLGAAHRSPLAAMGHTPLSATQTSAMPMRLLERKSAAGATAGMTAMDFGIQVFAPQPPSTSDITAQNVPEASPSSREESGTSAQELTQAELLLPDLDVQDAVTKTSPNSEGAAQCNTTAAASGCVDHQPMEVAAAAQHHDTLPPDSSSPCLAPEHGIKSAHCESTPTRAAGDSNTVVLPTVPRSVGSACTDDTAAQLCCKLPDVDTAAGPLRVQLSATAGTINIHVDPESMSRLQELQNLRVWVHGCDAPAEFGVEVTMCSSSRHGISTVHRYSCKDGLTSRTVIDRLCTVGPQATSGPAPQAAHVGVSDKPAATPCIKAATQTELAASAENETTEHGKPRAVEMPPPRKSVAWEVSIRQMA